MDKDKDVLFGWLAGRAGVDFELAQALATSQSDIIKQIQRLEETLTAQIHELHQNKLAGQLIESRDGELTNLRSEMQAFAERIGRLEYAARPVGQPDESLREEMAVLQVRLSERQNRLEARHSDFEILEQNVTAKIRGFEGKLEDRLRNDESGKGELGYLKSEIDALMERLGQVEQATQQVETFTTNDAHGFQGSVASLRAEIAALKNEFSEQQDKLQPTQSLIKEHDESLSEQVHEIEHRLTQQDESLAGGYTHLKEAIGAEIAAFHAQFDERQNRLEAQHGTIEKIERNITAKLRELEQQVGQKFRFLDSRDAELRQLKAETQTLARQLVHIGSAAQHSQKEATGYIQGMMESPVPPDAVKLSRDEENSSGRSNHAGAHASAKKEAPHNHYSQKDSGLESEKEQFRQLQLRMSAEIESVRAQLKERNGRWKVRKRTSSI
ncbi:MAG: hypothetical protein WD688_11575 [Candidatus Binatia bacterium]